MDLDHGFRRTLVRLKRRWLRQARDVSTRFQTNSREVEAPSNLLGEVPPLWFQTNSREVEATSLSFCSALLGFQTNSREVEAR